MAVVDPVLTLITTVVERKVVRIDGKNWPLRHSDELSLLALRGHANTFLAIAPLLALKSAATAMSEAQERELDRLLKHLVRAILIAPQSVHDKLSHDHRMAIVEVFSLLRAVDIRDAQGKRATAGAKKQRTSRTIQDKSARG